MEVKEISVLFFVILFQVVAITKAAPANSTSSPTLLELPQSRIYGGQNAAVGQFPYHVLVTRHGDGYIVVCGGAIISQNYVVTAAHCVDGYSPSDYWIRAGTVNFNSGGVEIQVAEVKIHPDYSSFNYDIAVLRLSHSLDFNNNIKPIPLASMEVPEGSTVTVTGWGGVSSGGLADILQYNTEEALNHDTCVKRMNVLAESMRCLAKSAGNGICGGDSGGPAVHRGVLIGVSSFGLNGCGSDLPDGFTNIVVTRDWIRGNSDVDFCCGA
ncbi:PREDICTED: trypsin delta/gamma-like [Rhagoletis zephyria]|uniref:trypsin delta/gamma-like n=1 Tax=Rhagoletis zephyria TaxID=28612 RepID=UPI00081196E2|nr:PREDICTED: trypsin delta/gamma-like [Rhagoletis zephyria]XP_036319411.1 trypsin delta-like [Rhagoletis pomonella]